MTQFQGDSTWTKAKRLLHQGYSWIEVVSYYKLLGGDKVKVYSIIDREKFLILDMTKEKNVILEDSEGNSLFAEYDDVLNSRKVFECQ